jgi:phosphoglycolate phosphatase
MIYKLLDELRCSENETCFVGDGPRDEMAAKRAKIDYIMVDWGFTEHTDAVSSVEHLREMLLA